MMKGAMMAHMMQQHLAQCLLLSPCCAGSMFFWYRRTQRILCALQNCHHQTMQAKSEDSSRNVQRHPNHELWQCVLSALSQIETCINSHAGSADVLMLPAEQGPCWECLCPRQLIMLANDDEELIGQGAHRV